MATATKWAVHCADHTTDAHRTREGAIAHLDRIVDFGACRYDHRVVQVDRKGRVIG